jgi:hypothetical protein
MTSPLRLPSLGPRDRRALRIGGWIVLPVLLATLVVRPLGSAWLDRRAALGQDRALLARELRLVTDAPRDRELLRAERRVLDASASRLFGGAEAVSASAELARYVAREASESRLQLEQAETEAPLDIPGAAPLPNGGSAAATAGAGQPLRVSIRARGDIEGIVAFLQAIEDGRRLVRVERIAITAADESATDDGSLLLTATLSGLARLGVSADTAAPPASPPAARNRFVSRREP